MASYTRLGSYLLSSEITVDPCGALYRAIATSGSAFDRHHLIRTFSPEVLQAFSGAEILEAQRIAALLAGSRGFGANFRIEGGRTPHVVCDYIHGRSLAQVLQKIREEQIPMGLDHVLSVMQGVAESLLVLDSRGLHHGTLSPHSIWISFEGATHILDAPFGPILKGLLPRTKMLEAALAPYRAPGLQDGLQQDLFALGAVMYEMITLEKLPPVAGIPAALAKATLHAAQEEGPLPAVIADLLSRLLLQGEAFPSAGAFNKELERVLFDGEYSPTTFNMAYFMHTLFRQESEQDIQAEAAEQGADYTPYLPTGAGTQAPAATGSASRRLPLLAGAVVVLILLGCLGYGLVHRGQVKEQALQNKIAELQQEKTENENKLLDLAKQEADQKQRQAQAERKARESENLEERTKAKKEVEEARAKSASLNRERNEALKRRQELFEVSKAIVQNALRPSAPPPPAAAPAPSPAEK